MWRLSVRCLAVVVVVMGVGYSVQVVVVVAVVKVVMVVVRYSVQEPYRYKAYGQYSGLFI